MSNETTPAIERAAWVIGEQADTEFPQMTARQALAAALDLGEIARAIDPAAFGPVTHGSNVSRYFRAQQVAGEKALAVRTAILGGAS